MIDIFYYTLGFVLYQAFCIVTFDIYSRKEGETSPFILVFIYIFYSILVGSVISFVESGESFFEILVQILIYVLASGFVLYFYYKKVLTIEKEKKYMENSF